MITENDNEHEIRIGNSLINATYVWRGNRCLGFYFWDCTQGLWRICKTDVDDVSWTEKEAKEMILGETILDSDFS
jgi:hypothetical protein